MFDETLHPFKPIVDKLKMWLNSVLMKKEGFIVQISFLMQEIGDFFVSPSRDSSCMDLCKKKKGGGLNYTFRQKRKTPFD